jgi:hypothetical protein
VPWHQTGSIFAEKSSLTCPKGELSLPGFKETKKVLWHRKLPAWVKVGEKQVSATDSAYTRKVTCYFPLSPSQHCTHAK